MDALSKDGVPVWPSPQDVRVRDQDLRMESVRKVCRRDDGSVRVHDRQQGGRRHPPVTRLHRTDASKPVALPELEHSRPIGPFRLRFPAASPTSPWNGYAPETVSAALP